MKYLDIKSLTKIYGKVTEVQSLLIKDVDLFGDEEQHEMTFFFFDGFCLCPNYNGKVYYMSLPKVEYFYTHKDEAAKILEEANLTDVKDILPYDISIFYGELAVLTDSTMTLEEYKDEYEDLLIEKGKAEGRYEDVHNLPSMYKGVDI